MTATAWTVAYRKPHANRFLRADNFAGTWDEASDLGRAFAARHLDLEVWTVPTADCDTDDRTVPEDRGNILVGTGRRVRILEGGAVDADLLPTPVPTTPAATDTFDRMANDDRWLGFGYLGGRRNALDGTDAEAPAQPERVAEVDAWLIDRASTLGLDYDALFAWANSRDGRHFADVVFGGDTIERAFGWGLAPGNH